MSLSVLICRFTMNKPTSNVHVNCSSTYMYMPALNCCIYTYKLIAIIMKSTKDRVAPLSRESPDFHECNVGYLFAFYTRMRTRKEMRGKTVWDRDRFWPRVATPSWEKAWRFPGLLRIVGRASGKQHACTQGELYIPYSAKFSRRIIFAGLHPRKLCSAKKISP